jgi:hypothetical protein
MYRAENSRFPKSLIFRIYIGFCKLSASTKISTTPELNLVYSMEVGTIACVFPPRVQFPPAELVARLSRSARVRARCRAISTNLESDEI